MQNQLFDVETESMLPELQRSAPGTPSKTVNFKISTVSQLYCAALHCTALQVTEREREKFLTAKYGAHQMALIRKRLKV